MRITNTKYQLGRISFTIARQAHIKAANITVDANHLRHIEIEHPTALKELNIPAYKYVKMIVDNYDEIRERPCNAIILVMKNSTRKDDTCTLELYMDNTTKEWQVKTAQPRRNVSNDKLLWEKKKGGRTT